MSNQEPKNDLRRAKNELRCLYREKRKALASKEKQLLDGRIARALFDTLAYHHAPQILLYAASKGEIETSEICRKALADGKNVLFPRCEGKHEMTFYYAGEYPASLGAFGIPEPEPLEAYRPRAADLCILPGLSFDREGFRLGYGGGFYDRFLETFEGTVAGLCYAGFVCEKLPAGKYDKKVDLLVTEEGLFRLR